VKILDGKALASSLQAHLKSEIDIFKKSTHITPGLAVILVGDDPASHAYVNKKAKACEEVGIYSVTHKMPNDIEEDDIIATIEMINQNPKVHGLLIQLPLPRHINTAKLLEKISPNKDVDGFHPCNFGKLVAGLDSFAPCTPLGIMKLLEANNIALQGLNVCIIGASNIVGKPLAAMLLNAGATIDVCHIYTKDLKSHTINADMICVGVGRANLLSADMVKDGAIVIDIGINKVDNKIVGDVDYENVAKKCFAITPVPGGVGPMTIATLLENTFKAAKESTK
jgi:methylenetetrahydrofolate dehydrogenase (NADP+)/methenyltetrahydrofolate cyclohydrolase